MESSTYIDEAFIEENPNSFSGNDDGLISKDDAEDAINSETHKFNEKKSPKPSLIVARALLNDYGLFGYIAKLENNKYKIFGYTLEPTKNIPEKGYIPSGEYNFKRWDSPKLKKTLRLYSVPNFTNVLVHVGNEKKETRGCILASEQVITAKNPQRLYKSRPMTDYLYDTFSNGTIRIGWL